MTAAIAPQTFAGRLAVLAGDIKLSHSVFALPWAILATFMAAGGAWPEAGQVALIVACMVLARTAAMGANRLFDAELDADNPRTARRAVPSGGLSKAFVTATIVACCVAFVGVTSGFGVRYGNWIPLFAAVPVLAFICAYPFVKRFSRLCHYYLGTALALAPVCAWAAIAGRVDAEPLLMAGAVLLWTAGFDIVYACQDYASDLATGVHSLPAKLGVRRSLWVARGSHVGCVGLLVVLGFVSPVLAACYFIAVAAAAVLLVVEHAVVRPTDLSRINLAFFTINGLISLLIGACGLIDVLRIQGG